MELKKYRVKMFLEHKSTADRYSVGIIDVYKDLETGIVTKVTLPVTTYESVSWADAIRVLGEYKKTGVASDKFVTSVKRMKVDAIMVDMLLLRDEHEMIMNYIQLQEERSMRNKKGTVQKLSDGTGVFIEDTKDKNKFKIDRSEIKQVTLMIMIAIDEVRRDMVHELLEYYGNE